MAIIVLGSRHVYTCSIIHCIITYSDLAHGTGYTSISRQSTDKLVSTSMKKARGNSCCQFSESYTDGLTDSGESGYWHIQPIKSV